MWNNRSLNETDTSHSVMDCSHPFYCFRYPFNPQNWSKGKLFLICPKVTNEINLKNFLLLECAFQSIRRDRCYNYIDYQAGFFDAISSMVLKKFSKDMGLLKMASALDTVSFSLSGIS